MFRNEEYALLERLPSHYNPINKFDLPKGEEKHYQQQYADIYFLRLSMLKPAVEEVARDAWADFEVCAAEFKPYTVLHLRSFCR